MKKIAVRYKVQSSLLKQETEHVEIHEDTWKARDNEGLPYVKNDVLSTVSVMQDILWLWKHLLDLV